MQIVGSWLAPVGKMRREQFLLPKGNDCNFLFPKGSKSSIKKPP